MGRLRPPRRSRRQAGRPVSVQQQVSELLDVGSVDEALNRVAAAAATASDLPPPASDPINDAVAAVLDGKPMPDVAEAAASAEQARQAIAAQVTACREVAQRLYFERRVRRKRNADRAFAFLADRLAAIIDEGQQVLDRLGTIDNAEAAIAADLADVWRRARELAAELALLRTLQVESLADVFGQPSAHTPAGFAPELPHISNEVWNLARTFATTRDYGTVWAETPADELPWASGEPLDALRWTCSPDSQAWVPTTEELTAVQDEARRIRDQERFDRAKVSVTPT